MKPAILSFLLLPALSAHASVCTNLAPAENQAFPKKIEVTWGPQTGVASIRVLAKGSENEAVASEGHAYAASRLGPREEARYGLPAFHVSDNPRGDLFANEERDSATLLFVEPRVMKGKAGHAKLWLHYHGDGYRGVQGNNYDCTAGSAKKGDL